MTSSSNWHESLPPKLSPEDMTTMKTQFEKNHPGEILDFHSTPSVRLWSLVHQHKSTRQSNISLSDVDCAMIETRSSKPLRSEIQVLSQLCWDDTPEVDINSARFSRDWFHRTSTVLRNAYVLCGMCDLQVFKAFDAKIAEHTFVQLDAELGLRHVVAQEFFNADKKIWNAIAQLYSQGSWTFKECLNEMSVVRPDISSLTYKTLIPPFTILKLQTYTLQTLIRAHHRSLHRCFPLPTIPVHLSPKPVLIHPHYLLLQFPLHPHCPIHPIPIGNPTSIHLLLLRKLHNQSDYFWTFLQGTAPLSCAATEANIDLFTLLILNLITLVTFSTMTILKTPSNWLTQALLGHSVCPPMSPLLFPPEEWWWTTPS